MIEMIAAGASCDDGWDGHTAIGLEASSVLGGSDVERTQEDAPHRLGGAEAASVGDDCDRLGGVLEAPACGLEAHTLDVARGRDTGLGTESAREVARAHVRALGHRVDGVLAADVLDDAALHLAQRLALGLLGGERGAELRLVAGTAQEQHEVASDRQRKLAAVVFLDEREREVHAGGDAGGRPHVAVLDEDRIGIDVDAWAAPGKRFGGGPVRRGASPVEQTCGGEQECACADGRRPARTPGCSGDPVEQVLVVDCSARAFAAGDDQRVDRRRGVVEATVGGDREAAGRGQWLAVAAEREQLITDADVPNSLRGGEDLERAGEVEALDAREEDEDDVALWLVSCHETIIAQSQLVCKDD